MDIRNHNLEAVLHVTTLSRVVIGCRVVRLGLRAQGNQPLDKEKARYLAIPGFPYLAPPAGLEPATQ